MNKFIFEEYYFDRTTLTATFSYRFQAGMYFKESITFKNAIEYNEELLDRVLFLSFMLVGTSYYKLFPSSEIEIQTGSLDDWQVNFFSHVYQEGLSQFAYENGLTRNDLAQFHSSATELPEVINFDGEGIIALQSGGKDSLLTASLLTGMHQAFSPWYVSYSEHHPLVLDTLGSSLNIAERHLDKEMLKSGAKNGGLNGHVPVTYIVMSFALIEAVLIGKNKILVSIGHEGEEPHGWIGDLPVNHQWSKTWPAEKAFSDYVKRYISPDIGVASPLRSYSELKIAELFVKNAWYKFGHKFSSCNRANYAQGSDNTALNWCGECPKCANSFLLFAPFLPAEELKSIFNGQDLFNKPQLRDTFKGLLGIDGAMKPFECIGEISELRFAYHKAQATGDYDGLPFEVPVAEFNYDQIYPHQEWASQLLGQPL